MAYISNTDYRLKNLVQTLHRFAGEIIEWCYETFGTLTVYTVCRVLFGSTLEV